jgi:hypothetical protein
LPAWVSALAPGQWYQIPNTAMKSVEPSPLPAAFTGPESKVIAWTSFVVDTRTSKVYSLANGGHNDYSGNEVDVLNLEVGTPAWAQVLAPTPNSKLTNCQSYYSDGRPASRHTYYGVTFNEPGDRFMLFGGAHWCEHGGFHTATSSFNVASGSWNGSAAHPSIPEAFSGVAAFTVIPSSGDVYMARNFKLGRWNRSANTVTTLNPSGPTPYGDSAMSAYDSTRGRILFLGGLNNDRHVYTLASNSFVQISLSGSNASSVLASEAALVYVPAIDRYLVRLGGAGGTVYQIHPETFAVSTLATSGGGSVPATINGPYNKFLYVPRLGGVIYVPAYDKNAWFLRVH